MSIYRLKKILFAQIILFFLFKVSIIPSELQTGYSRDEKSKTALLCFDEIECISLEVADTYESRAFGLMGRHYMEMDKGMLFLYEKPSIVSMWMLNTYIDLDIIFLRNNKVVSIIKNVKPCFEEPCKSYGPLELVDSVIEVNSGVASEKKLSKGQKINLIYDQ